MLILLVRLKKDMKSTLNEAQNVYLLLVKFWNIFDKYCRTVLNADTLACRNIRKFEESQNAENSENWNHLEVRNALMLMLCSCMYCK